MDINALFPSKYIKADDLNGRALKVCIDTVVIEEIQAEDGKEEKPVMYFRDKKKGMILNVTNARSIGDLHGGDTNAWSGKEIELYPTRVDFKGKMTDAIRVRGVIPPAAVDGGDNEPAF